jgi:hypothetical protein
MIEPIRVVDAAVYHRPANTGPQSRVTASGSGAGPANAKEEEQAADFFAYTLTGPA